MTIEQREIGSVVMLDLAGDLTAENDARLRDRVGTRRSASTSAGSLTWTAPVSARSSTPTRR
jgi:hypothetical protein